MYKYSILNFDLQLIYCRNLEGIFVIYKNKGFGILSNLVVYVAYVVKDIVKIV